MEESGYQDVVSIKRQLMGANFFHKSTYWGEQKHREYTPETNISPKNGWLEYYFPIGFRPIFRGKLAVSFREGKKTLKTKGWNLKETTLEKEKHRPKAPILGFHVFLRVCT